MGSWPLAFQKHVILLPEHIDQIAAAATRHVYPHSSCAVVTSDEVREVIQSANPSYLWRVVTGLIHEKTNEHQRKP